LRFLQSWHGGSAKNIFAPCILPVLLNNKKQTVEDQPKFGIFMANINLRRIPWTVKFRT